MSEDDNSIADYKIRRRKLTMTDIQKGFCSVCYEQRNEEGYTTHTNDCTYAGYSDRIWISDDGESFLSYFYKMPEFFK